MGFRFIRLGHLEVLQRADHGAAGGIKEGFFVGAVKNEKGFVLIPGAEVAAQKGKYPVFRSDLTAQNTAQLGKTDKAFQQMRFSLEMTDCLENRIERIIGRIFQEAGAVFHSLVFT